MTPRAQYPVDESPPGWQLSPLLWSRLRRARFLAAGGIEGIRLPRFRSHRVGLLPVDV